MRLSARRKSRTTAKRSAAKSILSSLTCETNVVPRKKSKPAPRHSQEDLRRLRDWIEKEIAFVDHPLFHEGNTPESVQKKLNRLRPDSLDNPVVAPKSEVGHAFVAGMVEMPLLTPEEEQFLFIRMNFLKWRAEQSRRQLTLNSPELPLVDSIEADLKESSAVRNRIVCSNLRLVVALATKLSAGEKASALDQISELVSEGTIPLIRAVELFDVSLGNRFSTYATWAVRNQMFRLLKKRRALSQQATEQNEVLLTILEDNRSTAESDEQLGSQHQVLVQKLLSQLTERERIVITARFGLDGQPRGQSLSDIAHQIGLSKERVRQVALASLEKLRELVVASDLEN